MPIEAWEFDFPPFKEIMTDRPTDGHEGPQGGCTSNETSEQNIGHKSLFLKNCSRFFFESPFSLFFTEFIRQFREGRWSSDLAGRSSQWLRHWRGEVTKKCPIVMHACNGCFTNLQSSENGWAVDKHLIYIFFVRGVLVNFWDKNFYIKK